jgi:effector-binding domain-containing protein
MQKWILGCTVVIIGVLTWFLFLKPYDFSVSFKAKTLPEIVNQSVKIWNSKIEGSIKQLENNGILLRIPYKSDSLTYQWTMEQKSDTTTSVKVSIRDENISLIEKLKIPFSKTDYEKGVTENLTEFIELLNVHLAGIKIRVLGNSRIDSTYCAYVPLKGRQVEKARGMMENYGLLSTLFVDQNVELNGHPFIEITRWDRITDSIYYNFCYPIIKKDSLPQHDKIKYKQFHGREVLKAVYNGNYMTSDRAWYALLNYAEKNAIKVTVTPIEVFVNNPNMGGNELEWETNVYLPIKQ